MAANKTVKIVPIVVEGLEINSQNVTFQKLQEFSLSLYEKLLNHKKQRNFLLLERDKLRTILENTRHEIKLANDIALNKDEELEQAQSKYRMELKEVDQEVKYIMYSHDINLEEVKEWENNKMIKTSDKNFVEELELLHEKREMKENLEKEKKRYAEKLRNLKSQHLEEITVLKQECYNIQTSIEMDFKKNYSKTIEQLTLKHEMEMSELEERKNAHMTELKKIHKSTVEETKSFFNSITAENLSVISSLKQNLNSVKATKIDLSDKVKKLKSENDKLREPLAKSEAEVKNLNRKVINYEKDLLSLKNNKRLLKQVVKEEKLVETKNSAADKKLKFFGSKESLFNLDSGCLTIMADLKNNMKDKKERLEEIIEYLNKDLKRKQATIEELTCDSEIYQAASQLNFELWSPKQLSYELAVFCKAHDELLRTLEAKLEEFCLTGEDLGFEPINLPNTGAISASLVSKQ